MEVAVNHQSVQMTIPMNLNHFRHLIQFWILGFGAKHHVNIHFFLQNQLNRDSNFNNEFVSCFTAERDKKFCIKALLSEQRDLSLQAAGHSLSAVHLKQRIFVYHRYLVALARSQKSSPTIRNPVTSLRKQAIQNEHMKKLELQVTFIRNSNNHSYILFVFFS